MRAYPLAGGRTLPAGWDRGGICSTLTSYQPARPVQAHGVTGV